MPDERLKRRHLRAPLTTDFLYEDDGHVFKGKTRNISEGGILLSALPHVPDIKLVYAMIDLPLYPDFQTITSANILGIKKEALERKIVRLRVRIVRSFEGKSDVDKVFENHVGCEFVKLDQDIQSFVKNYVSLAVRNIIFLLGLFEQMNVKASNLDLIRKVADLLGYPAHEKIAVLRQKVLHDYQSLESL